MNEIAEKYAGAGIGSIFLYTHEAHPGENYPAIKSMPQKYRHARALREEYGVRRPILVDSLDGACHRAFGSMPNMSWIFRRDTIPVYKSDWTDARSVDSALSYYLDTARSRRRGERLAPFLVERLDYRKADPEAFQRGLQRNGPQAVREFREAFH